MALPKYTVQTVFRIVRSGYLPIGEVTTSEGEALKLAELLNRATEEAAEHVRHTEKQ